MKTDKIGRAAIHLLLLCLSACMVLPVVFTAFSSFKSVNDIMTNPLRLLPERFILDNYRTILDRVPFGVIILNTVAIALTVMGFKLVTSCLAAYSFVFLRNRFSDALYFLFICTMFIPLSVTMIPNYITISKMGLLDRLMGVALPQLCDAMGIFLLRQHFRGIPESLIEAAKLEKTPHLTILFKIVLPVAKPAVIATGIIFFVNSWNEYVWPKLVLRTEGNYTLPLAAQAFIGAEGSADLNITMAMATATLAIPLVLFLIFQKFIIGTFASSGIKG